MWAVRVCVCACVDMYLEHCVPFRSSHWSATSSLVLVYTYAFECGLPAFAFCANVKHLCRCPVFSEPLKDLMVDGWLESAHWNQLQLCFKFTPVRLVERHWRGRQILILNIISSLWLQTQHKASSVQAFFRLKCVLIEQTSAHVHVSSQTLEGNSDKSCCFVFVCMCACVFLLESEMFVCRRQN